MRSFLILPVLASLVAAAALPPPDCVTFFNKAYVAISGGMDFITYWDSPAGACININKAFNNVNTKVVTQGRSVELYTNLDCKNKYKTSPATTGGSVSTGHAVKSFKVGKK
ncbi:hypothetical protein GGI21_001711 [Coemansia aciculifera]|uniref:Uncharacterized protein n=1 Tax=Coemansia aciculifera TaxID=417176 RepID=A0ACC1M0V5_9FUNG|nr:hypothetical protein IWW38_003272 [Coemansia aciculifera]KAJ2909605.1 hypothetical protein GGI21_001711 [Coemansia aciculifera]